jgi:hypothetical protein
MVQFQHLAETQEIEGFKETEVNWCNQTSLSLWGN